MTSWMILVVECSTCSPWFTQIMPWFFTLQFRGDVRGPRVTHGQAVEGDALAAGLGDPRATRCEARWGQPQRTVEIRPWRSSCLEASGINYIYIYIYIYMYIYIYISIYLIITHDVWYYEIL